MTVLIRPRVKSHEHPGAFPSNGSMALFFVVVIVALFWFEYVELAAGAMALGIALGLYAGWFHLVRLKSWPRLDCPR